MSIIIAGLKTLMSKPFFWLILFVLFILFVLWYIHTQFNKLTLELGLTRKQKVWLWIRIAFALIAVHVLYLKFFRSTEEVVSHFKKKREENEAKKKK